MARHRATSKGNIPYTSAEEIEQNEVDRIHTEKEPERKRKQIKLAIDSGTRKKIIALANEDKQRNMLASAIFLLNKKMDGELLTAEEITELDNFKIVWQQVKDLRASGESGIISEYRKI